VSTSDAVAAALDPFVRSGQMPGYVAGWRRDGTTESCAAGTLAVDSSDEMSPHSLFRIASLSKPVGAVLALSLAQDGTIALDDEVARWLPELAGPQVLKRIDGPLDETVPAQRPILVRDLLTMTAGFGLVFGLKPLQKAMMGQGLMPGPFPPAFSYDEFMARLSALPLAIQPGAGWLYHTSADVLSVLLARAAKQPVSELLNERITEPLGMTDTGFFARDPSRRATAYQPRNGGLQVLDPADGVFAEPPEFEALGSGLVSTIPDYLAFQAMLADGGGSVLSQESVALLRTDRLTDSERESAQSFLGAGRSWGLMVEVFLAGDSEPALGAGSFGWMGGSGTTAYIDPAAGVFGALFTQRAMESNMSTEYYNAFWGALANGA
jgi:CubicO group peptidase (beta-lactamase class C family)